MQVLHQLTAIGVVVSCSPSPGLAAQSGRDPIPRGFETVDHEIKIGVLAGRLR